MHENTINTDTDPQEHNEPTQHRLQHIVNRNSNSKRTLQQILAAFDATLYASKCIEDRITIEKFFKECDAEDYYKLLSFDEVRAENIKTIYLASPASQSLYRGEWDDLLELGESERFDPAREPKIQKRQPRGLLEIIKQRQQKQK